MRPNTSPRLTKNDWLLLGLLLLALTRVAIGAFHWLDLNFGDDARYLEKGVSLHLSALPVGPAWAVWGPIYQLWFRLLWAFKHNPTLLYFTTILTLGIITPVLLYLLLRRLQVAQTAAFLITWGYGLLYANWVPEPRVTLFAVAIILLGWVTITYLPNTWLRWWGLTGVALLAAYVRPEFWLSMWLFLMVTAWKGFQEWHQHKPTFSFSSIPIVVLSTATLLSIALVLWWSSPYQTDRTIYAFGQHYTYNVLYCIKEDIDPHLHWEDIRQRDFGTVHTLLEAFTHNPTAFSRHLACNAQRAPLEIAKMFFGHIPFIRKGYRLLEALFLAGLAAIWAIWAIFKQSWQTIWQRARSNVVIASIIWAVPILVSTLLIYPREHYLAQLAFLFWLSYGYIFCGANIKENTTSKAPFTWWRKGQLIILLLLVLFTPPFSNLFPYAVPRRPRVATIATLQALQWHSPLRISGTAHSGYFRAPPYLLPREATAARPKRPEESLEDFLSNVHPDIIIVASNGREFADDPTWETLQQGIPSHGYCLWTLPTGDAFGPWRLIVRRAIFPPCQASP